MNLLEFLYLPRVTVYINRVIVYCLFLDERTIIVDERFNQQGKVELIVLEDLKFNLNNISYGFFMFNLLP